MLLRMHTLAFPMDHVEPGPSVTGPRYARNDSVEALIAVGAVPLWISFQESPLNEVKHQVTLWQKVSTSFAVKTKEATVSPKSLPCLLARNAPGRLSKRVFKLHSCFRSFAQTSSFVTHICRQLLEILPMVIEHMPHEEKEPIAFGRLCMQARAL